MVVVALNSYWICSNEIHHTDALTEPARMTHVGQGEIHGDELLETSASIQSANFDPESCGKPLTKTHRTEWVALLLSGFSV